MTKKDRVDQQLRLLASHGEESEPLTGHFELLQLRSFPQQELASVSAWPKKEESDTVRDMME
jgi:hypothetical protein